MSKKCTHCGSYNTERSVMGTANFALRQAARLSVSAGAVFVVGCFNKTAAHGAGHAMLHNTENWVSGVKQFHCCECGNDFIPMD